MNKTVFVDLEETLIDSIDRCEVLPVNVGLIKDFIQRERPNCVETFSWAFWEESDISKWLKAKPIVEEMLGVAIRTQTFDVKQQRLAFLKDTIGHIEPSEIFDFLGLSTKERIFEWFIRKSHISGQFILIDDTVPNKEIRIDSSWIRLINVNTMGGRHGKAC